MQKEDIPQVVLDILPAAILGAFTWALRSAFKAFENLIKAIDRIDKRVHRMARKMRAEDDEDDEGGG